MEITSNVDNKLKKLDYDVYMLDQEMIVGNRIPYDELIKDVINDAKQKIEQLIYGFVYRLALSSAEEDPEILYYVQILSGDNRFMTVLQEIYENRHKGFERGYQMLTNKQ